MKFAFIATFFLMFACACGTSRLMHPVEKTYIKLNHTSLYCERTGAGTPIIFIHGFSLDHRMWDDQFPSFSSHFKVIRYDLRGFGQSGLPEEGHAYTHHDDLAALMDHLGIDKAYLVGLSLGGRVATSFALTFPNRVLGLVLIDAVLEGYTMKAYKMDYIYEAARTQGTATAIQLWMDHPTFTASRKNKSTDKKLKSVLYDYSGWHFNHKNPMMPLSPPCIDRLHEIEVPTLILIGEEDLPDMQEISEVLHQKIRGSELIRIPGAGHMSNMDQTHKVNRHILDFLAR